LLIINFKINDLNHEGTQRHTTETIISTSKAKWLQPFVKRWISTTCLIHNDSTKYNRRK